MKWLLLACVLLISLQGRAATILPVTTSSGGAISAAILPTRTSGVAPLAVFFDSGATTDPGVSNTLQDLGYSWDFGDPLSGSAVSCGSPVVAGSGYWACGAQAGDSSKNFAAGPFAGHVFETAGTYAVTLTVSDGTSRQKTTRTITVTDPDTYYSGANTTCFSNTTTFNGCPPGATRVSHSSDLAGAVSTYGGIRKRLLFERGGSWVGGATFNFTGPMTVGTYGMGAKPRITGNVKQIYFGRAGTASDIRFMDLDFAGANGTMTEAFYAEGRTSQITILRCDANYMRWMYDFAPDRTAYYGQNVHDQLAIVDSTAQHCVGGGKSDIAYIGAQHFIMLGGKYNDSSGCEHVLRFPYLYKFVLSDTNVSNPASKKHALKLHAGLKRGAPSKYTELGVISHNKFSDNGSSVNWVVSIEPQNAHSNEDIRKLIIERNWLVAGSSSAETPLHLSLTDSVIRNNVIDCSASTDCTGIALGRRGIETAPTRDNFYNNTLYSRAGGRFMGIRLGSRTSSCIARNNLAYAPRARGSVINDAGSGNTADHNTGNSGLGSVTTSPNFSSTEPFDPANAKIIAGSYAIGSGARVPVLYDLFDVAIPSPPDLGAVTH